MMVGLHLPPYGIEDNMTTEEETKEELTEEETVEEWTEEEGVEEEKREDKGEEKKDESAELCVGLEEKAPDDVDDNLTMCNYIEEQCRFCLHKLPIAEMWRQRSKSGAFKKAVHVYLTELESIDTNDRYLVSCESLRW